MIATEDDGAWVKCGMKLYHVRAFGRTYAKIEYADSDGPSCKHCLRMMIRS